MVLQRRETAVVLAAISALGSAVESYQYDGFLVHARHRAIVEQWISSHNTADVEFVIKPFEEPLQPPPFRRFNPRNFEIGPIPSVEDVPGRQLLIKTQMEQYIFKILTSPGFVFLPDGPLSSLHDVRPFNTGYVLFANIFVPMLSTKDPPTVRLKPFWKWWTAHPDYRQYNDMQSRPPPLSLLASHCNTFQGLIKLDMCITPATSIAPFLGHCAVMMKGNANWGIIMLDLLVHRVQRPRKRTELALVFLGVLKNQLLK